MPIATHEKGELTFLSNKLYFFVLFLFLDMVVHQSAVCFVCLLINGEFSLFVFSIIPIQRLKGFSFKCLGLFCLMESLESLEIEMARLISDTGDAARSRDWTYWMTKTNTQRQVVNIFFYLQKGNETNVLWNSVKLATRITNDHRPYPWWTAREHVRNRYITHGL